MEFKRRVILQGDHYNRPEREKEKERVYLLLKKQLFCLPFSKDVGNPTEKT